MGGRRNAERDLETENREQNAEWGCEGIRRGHVWRVTGLSSISSSLHRSEKCRGGVQLCAVEDLSWRVISASGFLWQSYPQFQYFSLWFSESLLTTERSHPTLFKLPFVLKSFSCPVAPGSPAGLEWSALAPICLPLDLLLPDPKGWRWSCPSRVPLLPQKLDKWCLFTY